AAEEHRHAIALPWRHTGFLEKVLQGAARPARVGLQALSAAARADYERFSLQRLGADAMPFHRTELQRENRIRGPSHEYSVPIGTKFHAVVLQPRAGATGSELLEHFHELGLARRAQ